MIEFVKPKEGQVVIDPETRRPLPPEGKNVKWNSYWIRRLLKCKSIELIKLTKTEKKFTKKKKSESSTEGFES